MYLEQSPGFRAQNEGKQVLFLRGQLSGDCVEVVSYFFDIFAFQLHVINLLILLLLQSVRFQQRLQRLHLCQVIGEDTHFDAFVAEILGDLSGRLAFF